MIAGGGREVRHLERDGPIELRILGQVDGAHAALSQFADDLVAAELRRQVRGGGHGWGLGGLGESCNGYRGDILQKGIPGKGFGMWAFGSSR